MRGGRRSGVEENSRKTEEDLVDNVSETVEDGGSA